MTGPATVVVLAGGGPVGEQVAVSLLGERDAGGRRDRFLVIAADSGLALAEGLGLRVDLAVGDFDSVDHVLLGAAEAAGTRVERHPVAKDQTDLELALDRAAGLVPDRIVVLAGGAGRLDHLVANAHLLTSNVYASFDVAAGFGTAIVHVARRRTEMSGTPGELVTLLAFHRPAYGVTTTGLRYPLHAETLYPASSRGVSNELEGAQASVEVRDGVVLVIRPGPE